MRERSVVVITGLPGTGKSTLADRLAMNTSVPAFSRDWLMGSLAANGALSRLSREAFVGVDRGLLGTLIRRQLALGQSAIVDCLVDDDAVDTWRADARAANGDLFVVHAVCSDPAVHRSRIEGRIRGIPGWHEVDWSHVEKMRVEYPPPTDPQLTLDSMGSVDDNIDAILERFGN